MVDSRAETFTMARGTRLPVTQRYMVLIVILALLMLAKCEDPNPWSDPGRRGMSVTQKGVGHG